MNTSPALPQDSNTYRNILGVKFFVGSAPQAIKVGVRSGLMVAPAAPALLDLEKDQGYREALRESDLVITDSGFLVLLWNAFMTDTICRISGLEYLELLLAQSDFDTEGGSFWVMPSQASLERNLRWLRNRGHAVRREDCYIAPKYPHAKVEDETLVQEIEMRQPKHVVICLGGGIQEKLGLHIKRRCRCKPAIHCIGAAIGFLTGDQVRIPRWADQWILGWLFRCVSNPSRFVPRYARALKLVFVLWRYRGDMPDLVS